MIEIIRHYYSLNIWSSLFIKNKSELYQEKKIKEAGFDMDIITSWKKKHTVIYFHKIMPCEIEAGKLQVKNIPSSNPLPNE